MRRAFNSIFAAVFVVAAVSQIASAENPNDGSGGKSLTGAWFLNVAPTGIPPFVSLGTFGADGTTTNISSVSMGAPGTTGLPESPGYGVWTRTGAHTYAVTFVTITGDGAGGFSGSQKVRATLEVGPTGDALSGPFQVDVFDATGHLIVSATGTVSGTRIKVEPL